MLDSVSIMAENTVQYMQKHFLFFDFIFSNYSSRRLIRPPWNYSNWADYALEFFLLNKEVSTVELG